MSEFSQISRLQEESRKALVERQQRLLTCEKFKQDYEKLEELLKTLPHKTSHEVMVPIGSVAFMPGKLVHTNEITVLLGDNWFAERSASQALEIVARRKKYLETTIAGINADIKGFDARLKFAADIQSTSEENSEVKEIKEDLTLQDEERLSNRGARKAHAKAKRCGGSKNVEGLESNIKDKITQKDREVKPLAAEEISLFARLDELEEKETANDELDQLNKDNSDEEIIKSDSGYIKEEDVRWVQSSTANDKDSAIKKVTWEAGNIKKEASENSQDSDDESDDDVQRTISVKFSHLSTSFQGQIPEQCSEQPTVITPADIYSQFTPKQELKSILRKPSVEEKEKQTSVDKLASTLSQQTMTDITKEKAEKEDFNSQKAFTGTIVEKPAAHSELHDSSLSQINTAQAGKKPSRFKAARQKHQ